MIKPTEPPAVTGVRGALALMSEEEGWAFAGYREHLVIETVLTPQVTPVRAVVLRNEITGEVREFPFPHYAQNEVNYGASVKALVAMLTLRANVSIGKTKELLYEASRGALDVSTGWISERSREFALKSEKEQDEAFSAVFSASWQGVDATVTKNNGKKEAIGIAHGNNAVVFKHNVRKGDELMELLPCSPKLGTESDIVGDREAAVQKCGKEGHQDCLAHYDRELQGIMEMEPHNSWHRKMHELFQELMKTQTAWLKDGWTPSEEQVNGWRARYDEYIALGKKEYIAHPPTRHYLKGYDLMKTLEERKENALLFLRKPYIPCTNNKTEAYAKQHKRALHARMTFRSGQSIDDHCAYLTVTETMRLNDKSIFEGLLDIFSREGQTRAH